ncbi:claudin-34 [Girardinichthys multiradiatus]|uniref:claudin-34 n=1 Tax=Girardinichthys multiradiatus TaxID=208333 RepID=UPI001FAC5222|nr:claudin-34 [Girardinichthys multiradiatus]XP_047230440.1 claudin-34 [Girardinichthys multiradiatus]XP_047230441.1 claudin-34 [Girardinichthys multiradiatus]
MIYVAHTAHWQFLGLLSGCLAWLFIMTTTGINEWRLWYVDDVSIITSGIAWVGIWRACFYSHVLPETENCQSINISDSFIPTEIQMAQVLMMLAVIFGLLGNITAALAMRMAYFSVEDHRYMRMSFVLAGALCLVTAVFSLVPLLWNMASVLNNSTIDFPPEFNLPVAPVRQSVGAAIIMGILASTLMLVSGAIFLCYKYSMQSLEQTTDPLNGPWTVTTLPKKSELRNGDSYGMDNLGFHSEEIS